MRAIKHYGDITKIDGSTVPIADIVCGGSPCQDLSVAGKREGLSGARSGLFMEQIRVIREMRNEFTRQLRMRGSDVDRRLVKPRFMVWENVPGAFSSNKGEDFRVVLEETAKVADENAVIPRPANGKWTPAGLIVGDGWSIAYRLHDAQWWGVPQRRKRICMVADFNGESAGEILFELLRETDEGNSESSFTDSRDESRPEIQSVGSCVSGNNQSSREEGERTTSGAEGGTNPSSYTLKIRGGAERDSSGKRAGKGPLIQTELSATLGVSQDQTLITGINGDRAGTLDASYYKGCGERQGIERDVVFCLEGNGSRDSHKGDGYKESNTMYTLNTVEQHGVAYGLDGGVMQRR